MKNIIVTALFLLLSTNAFACYDESLGGEAKLDNCLVDAQSGDAVAQDMLGAIYAYGQGTAKDYKEAVKWYRKAAEQEHKNAQYMLGLMYDYGQGVAQDYKEAMKWYTKADKQGVVNAQYSLGYMYEEGRGVAQDYKEAIKWYTKASGQGHAEAQYNLGDMYNNGRGVIQDYVSAHMWYNICAAYHCLFGHRSRDLLAMRMTPSQIEKAQDMARDWMAEHQ
jgi:TPR repeat protein